MKITGYHHGGRGPTVHRRTLGEDEMSKERQGPCPTCGEPLDQPGVITLASTPAGDEIVDCTDRCHDHA